MYVIPTPGRLVRDPRTKSVLPAEGTEVERSSFWLRRLAKGDVTRRPEKPVTTEMKPLPRATPRKSQE